MNQKVFISYSWTTPQHEEWVINLAEKLMSDGIDVVIDKWDLKEGHDLYNFMESMVKSPEINKVLIILDRKYSEKADARSGGVGTETQIISPKVYKNASQEKFLPIVAERDKEGKAFIPTFLEGRVYIDLSAIEHYEENYEILIRNIYSRPAYSKPKVGTPPGYLFDETPMNFETSQLLRGFDNQIEKHPERINSIIRDFLNSFHANLDDFSIEFKSNNQMEIGKQICDNIQQYTPLRNNFISFFNKVIKLEIEFDFDILVSFFEGLPLFESPDKHRSSWSEYEFDNYRIIIFELFLYLMTIGLKNENFVFVENLIYSTYFVKNRHRSENEPKSFDTFYRNVSIIDQYYKETYSKNFLNPMADLIIKRIPDDFSVTQIVQADLLCYHISKLNGKDWFPQTYIYDTSNKYELFYKLVSKRHFEKVKQLFDVNTIEELKNKLIELEEIEGNSYYSQIGYSGSFERVSPIYRIIDKENIGTKR